eukprot:gene15334-20664_t
MSCNSFQNLNLKSKWHKNIIDSSSNSQTTTSLQNIQLSNGEFENSKIRFLKSVDENLGYYEIEGLIKAKELNGYLNEYKQEMKQRKVTFPGFRPGNIPPFAMTDVRRYLVCYGLETTIGQLCNLNNLVMCDESGNEAPFGEDSYYDKIIKEDFRGYNFTQQRDAWREGVDFVFKAEFYAINEEPSDEDDSIDSENVNIKNAIDVETVPTN